MAATTEKNGQKQQGAETEAQQPQAKRDPHVLQIRWLAAAKNKPVEILLMNGQTVCGTLIGADQFVLWLKEESGPVAMLYKHSCAVLRRVAEGGENGEPEQ